MPQHAPSAARSSKATSRRRAVTTAALALVTAGALVSPAAAHADTGSSETGSLSDLGGAVSGSAAPFVGSVGSASGSLAGLPVDQVLGSANGSLGNPGPVAKSSVTLKCPATVTHQRPVLLLHGTYANGDQVGETDLGTTLRKRGYCTAAPTYGACAFAPHRGGLASIENVGGPQAAAALDAIAKERGVDQVDVVGFSQGGAVAGYLAKVLRPGKVHSVVSLAGFWGSDASAMLPGGIDVATAGSLTALGNIEAISDLLPGSSMMRKWNAGGTPFLKGTRYSIIASENDVILPPSRSFVTADVLATARAQGVDVTQTAVQTGCAKDHTGHDAFFNGPRAIDMVDAALSENPLLPLRCTDFA